MIKNLFQILSHFLYHKIIGKNNTKPNKIRPFCDDFNWDSINFSPTPYDYKQFEDDNEHVNLNISKFYSETNRIAYIYESKFGTEKDYEVNLLLLENKHYVCIKDLANHFQTLNLNHNQ